MSGFEELTQRIKVALRDFSGQVPNDTDFWRFRGHKPPREDFPVPDLVLIVLRNIMGFPSSGREEKVRWSVYCTFKGEPLAFELRKFGFTVSHADGSPVELQAALDQLRRAVWLAEGVLQHMADDEAKQGNVTVANLFSDFDARYRFFREKADQAYVTPDPPMTPIGFDKDGKPTGRMGTIMKGPREGSYYTAAMIDAFFSRSEHLLVLVLPFTGFDPQGDALRRFIGNTWDEKFKSVFDVNKDPEAKCLYDSLKAMKQRLRNPFSHGGFEKGWASLYFHFPGVGAIPASLTRFRDSIQFNFLPVRHNDHKEVCALFDQVDGLFASAGTKMGYEYATSGLDVAFDEKTRDTYRQAKQSEETLRDFIKRQHYLVDIHANMDY